MPPRNNAVARNSLSQTLSEFSHLSVLIVSDKDVLFRTIRDCLRDAGMTRVSVVPNRKSAWEKLEFDRAELMIIDMDVESNDSLELIDEVKKHDTLFQTPIIAVTGHALKDHILKIARAGADDVMVKPFPLKQLRDRVAAALNKG